MNAKGLRPGLILLLVLCLSQAAMSKSAYDSVHRGNELYGDGQYSEAIKSYDQALVDSPQTLEPKFDKANSYFRLDDLPQAIDLYKQVAAESRDMQLVARSKYNLGNCYFQQGLKQKDSDMRKAIEDLQAGISYWRQVLDIDPHCEKAAKNIEVARLTIKDMIDQLNKQQQQQQQEQQQKQMQENLKQLMEQQKSLADKTQQTKQKADSNSVSQQQASADYNDIAKQQSDLKDKTEQTAEKMRQQNDPNKPNQQMQQASEQLSSAVDNQKGAEKELNSSEPAAAKQSQDKAAEDIEKALKSLSGNQDQNQQQKQQQQEQQSSRQTAQSEPNQPAEPNQAQQQPQQEAAALDATAQEILDKEQQQRRERQMLQSYGYQKVDKDW